MAKVLEQIDDALAAWIAAQPLFFVATAPVDGHVNVSPKGYDTFRVLGPTTVAYLDLTGSGVETIAHLADNGRITVMFCAFDGPPKIVRLYGTGHTVRPGDDDFDELVAHFEPMVGTRSVIVAELDRIQSSCGMSIPRMATVGERDDLHRWAERKGTDGLATYLIERNSTSIDGLPGLGRVG